MRPGQGSAGDGGGGPTGASGRPCRGSSWKALVFDLDDTLYPEESYVWSGFRAVARWLEEQGALPEAQAFEAMESAFRRGVRNRIFDGLLASLPGAGALRVDTMVQVYRTHVPELALFPGMADLLQEAKAEGLGLGLISDGWLASQERKVEALGLERWFDPILLTDRWGRDAWKPNPLAFCRAQAALGAGPAGLVYIGNDPAKDFQAPAALGWDSVRLIMPGQLERPGLGAQPTFQAAGIRELRNLLWGPPGDRG